MNNNILVVDDEQKMARVISALLQDEGYATDTAFTGNEGLSKIKTKDYFLVLTDLKLPDIDGIAVLKGIKDVKPSTEVILMTAYASAQTAVAAMKEGAYEYIIKPFETDELLVKVKHIEQQQKLNEENLRLKKELAKAQSFQDIIGKSKKMQDVFSLMDKVAEREVTILIRGESGTGKEMVARGIHQQSQRKDHPFVVVNCSALPETLLESELFGYEKGAFTGATKQKPGHFEAAGQGTIFLDEIGDISPAIQVKLLRVLEEKMVTHLGSSQPIPVRARIITATNRDLEQAISENTFREDLYYRLNVFPIHLPPLRDRKEDLPLLIEHFLDGHPIDKKAAEGLLNHRWTGNVRELENVLERAKILAGETSITMESIPASVFHQASSGVSLEIPDEGLCLEELEKDLVYQALDKAGGNKTNAAKLLGITRRMLYSKLEKYENNVD